MKITAMILKSPFALDAEYEELCSELVRHGVKWIRRIESLQELLFWRDFDSQTKVIWFENPAIRFDIAKVIEAFRNPQIEVICGESDADFGSQQGRKQVIGFTASSVNIINDRLVFKAFHVYPFNVSMVKDHRRYQVFIPAHSRPEYLRLSLASTVNAFAAYPNKVINLVINEDRGQFDSILPMFPTVNVIRYENNMGFNTLYNLVSGGLVEKGVFFYFEDDFVLPEDLELMHPFWAREFYDMAENRGFVGWRSSTYPYSYNLPNFWGNFNLKTDPAKKWVFNFGCQRILTGYGFANHTDNFLRAAKLTQKVTDEFFSTFSRFDASPTLVGYHLGLNKNIDYPTK